MHAEECDASVCQWTHEGIWAWERRGVTGTRGQAGLCGELGVRAWAQPCHEKLEPATWAQVCVKCVGCGT